MVLRLQHIRDHVPYAEFVYIMRQTDDPMVVSFVVDADALQDEEGLDTDNSGVVETDEEGSYVGDLYDVHDVPALQGHAFQSATTDDKITYDQWGALISGYAPIRRNGDDSVAGAIGIDMSADNYLARSRRAFSPLIVLFIVLVASAVTSVLVRYMLFRRKQAELMLEEEKTQLLRLASHQLGAPIATFRWWLEILSEQIKCKPGGPCDQLREGLERMTQIVERLNHVVEMENRSSHAEARKIPLRTALTKALASLTSKQKRKKHRITVTGKYFPRVHMDPELLEGVLHELVDNAMDYSKDGTAIVVSTKRINDSVEISVRDKGIGIAEDELELIFTKFRRGSNAEAAKSVGNGMGLWIANRIITQAGGDMRVESTLGKGTTFTVRLPVGFL